MNTPEQTYLETEEINFRYILMNIWTKPRQVFRLIQDNDYNKYQWLVLLLGLIAGRLSNAINKGIAEDDTALSVVLVKILLPAIAGIAVFYLIAFLMSATGQLLKGQVYTGSIFRLMGYVQIPTIISLLITLPWIAFYGLDFFRAGFISDSTSYLTLILFWAYFAINIVLAIYAAVLYIIGLAEIQQFSIGKAILNIALPALVLVLLVLIIMLPALLR